MTYHSSEEIDVDDDHEPAQIDEEDITRVPNILMARWACEEDAKVVVVQWSLGRKEVGCRGYRGENEEQVEIIFLLRKIGKIILYNQLKSYTML